MTRSPSTQHCSPAFRAISAAIAFSLLFNSFSSTARADDKNSHSGPTVTVDSDLLPSVEVDDEYLDSFKVEELDLDKRAAADDYIANQDQIMLEAGELAAKLEEHLEAAEPLIKRKHLHRLISKGKLEDGFTSEMAEYVQETQFRLGRARLAWLVENGGVDEQGIKDTLAVQIIWDRRNESNLEALGEEVRSGKFDEIRKVRKWINKAGEKELHQVLLAGRDARLEQWAVALGRRALLDTIIRGDKEDLVYENSLGRAEATSIDELKTFKVALKAHDAIRILFVPSELELDSKHLDQYGSRIMSVAGEDGKGRHYLVAQFSDVATNKAQVVQYKETPKTFRARFRNWAKSVNAGLPDRAMFAMAAIFTAAQVMITGAAGLVKAHNEAIPFNWNPMYLSAAFGMAIGPFLGTWKNIRNNPKSRWSRAWRGSVLSFAFAYSLLFMDDKEAAKLTVMDFSGFLAHAKIVWAVMLGKIASDYWAELTRLREEKGLNRGRLLGFKRTNFEYQLIGLGPDTIKTTNWLGITIPLATLGVDAAIPIGTALLYGAPFYMQYISVKYAEHLSVESASKLRSNWEDFIRLGPVRRIPKKVSNALLKAFNRGGDTQAECNKALTPSDSESPAKQDEAA